jgi:hypothetical protein
MLCKDYQEFRFSNMSPEDVAHDNTDNFMDYYEIKENSDYYNIILGIYFSYTTLSTVGFGDLAPRSDPERAICAIVLMIGVSVFSIFLGNFTAIIEAYKAINKDLEDTTSLDLFFGLMRHFNNDAPLDFNDFENRVRLYFSYRWDNDRNALVHTESDAKILNQLPEFLQDKIYTTFLYSRFLFEFSFAPHHFFKFRKRINGYVNLKDPYYSWTD